MMILNCNAHHHFLKFLTNLLAFFNRYSYQEFLSVMDPLQSLCVVPSDAPAFPRGSESPRVGSGNPGLSSLESTPTVTRSTSRALHQTSLPSIDTRSHTASVLQTRERRQRKHKDPLFTKAELQSEKYLAYRKKNKQGGKKPQEEQVWTDELEEVFQLGMI